MYKREVKMIEILQVIILACQVGNGFRVLTPVIKYQKKCQKEMIECVSTPSKDRPYMWTDLRLSKCIKERE
jgi:hypothetical protein